MKKIKSCGFIVYKLDDEGQKYLLLHQTKSGTWSFPKGRMEAGEDELQTALRELYEETGLVADPVPGFREEYTYLSDPDTEKTVVLFLTEAGEDPVTPEEGAIDEIAWLDAGEAVARMEGRNVLPAVSAADHYAVSVFLRDLLSTVPCTPGNEYTMKEFLKAFLNNCSKLETQEMDNWFYAIHHEDDSYPWVAVRAGIDAMLDAENKPFFGTGNDGHAAVLACLAVLQSELKLKKNILYLFEPETGTGQGPEKVLPILQKYKVTECYGFHNVPGQPLGKLLLRSGTFACSSFGLVLRLVGKAAPAPNPEDGVNPCFYAAGILSFWDNFFDPKRYKGLVKGTVVGLTTDTVDFGRSPAVCDIALSLRGENEADLDALESSIYEVVNSLADKYDLTAQNFYTDYFPVTANDRKLVKKAEVLLPELGNVTHLKEPVLWSDDFGRYAELCRTYYFGVGLGEDADPLRSPEYDWDDRVNWRMIQALRMLTEN